jgi:hypothetical protein
MNPLSMIYPEPRPSTLVESRGTPVSRFGLGTLCIAGALAFAPPAGAQAFPFSQRGSVGQTLAFTDITITYSRPVARGRVLFGGLVPWNRVWHPGADSATLITFSHDVLVEDRTVKAGEYSLWLIPRERAPWTVILSRAAHVFHAPYPGDSLDALRLEVAPEPGAHMETLSLGFPVVGRDDAVLRVHWGDVMVPVRIKAPFRPGERD